MPPDSFAISQPLTTRFAPSPTGRLHPGHAFSALTAFRTAQETGGRFLLRIEDIDFTRCRPEFTAGILEDLEWLGITWETPVRVQSQHIDEYRSAADCLLQQGLLYPCFCTRKEIQQEIAAAGGAPHGIDGPLYPGTCRRLSDAERRQRIDTGTEYALRLNLQAALQTGRQSLTWHDRREGIQTARPELLGDVVLVRKDIGCSYHLAVVHDDALQGVNCIIRGQDLFEATHLHRLLQSLLQLPTPEYLHHELRCDSTGRRFAKRDSSITLQSLRNQGVTSADVRQMLGFG
ncbi:MAG: tRNA glutamyl-Q(34) synthetase GluQRS [Planctomycetaceae bacterium]